MPDFNFHPASISGQVLDAVRNKQARELEIQQSQQELKIKQEDHAMAQIQQTAANAASMVSGLVSSAKAKQHQEAIAALGKLMGEGNRKVTGPALPDRKVMTSTMGQVNIPGATTNVPGEILPPPQVAYSTTPEYKTREMQALLNADPENFTKQSLEQAFSEKLLAGGGGAGAAGKEQVYFLTLKDGTKIMSRFAPGAGFRDANGAPLSPDVLKQVVGKQYAGRFQIDPSTGRTMFGDSTLGTTSDVQTPGQLGGAESTGIAGLRQRAPALVPTLNDIVKEVSPDSPSIAPLIEGAAQGQQAQTILQNPKEFNEVSLNAVVTGMARQSGEKGPLSEADKAQFRDAISWLQKAKSYGYQKLVGELSPEMTTQLTRLAALMQKRNKAVLDRRIMSSKYRAKQSLGRYWTDDLDEVFPTSDQLMVTGDELYQASEKDAAPEPPPDAGGIWTAADERRFQELQSRQGGKK